MKTIQYLMIVSMSLALALMAPLVTHAQELANHGRLVFMNYAYQLNENLKHEDLARQHVKSITIECNNTASDTTGSKPIRVGKAKLNDKGQMTELISYRIKSAGLLTFSIPEKYMEYQWKGDTMVTEVFDYVMYTYESRYAIFITDEGIDDYMKTYRPQYPENMDFYLNNDGHITRIHKLLPALDPGEDVSFETNILITYDKKGRPVETKSFSDVTMSGTRTVTDSKSLTAYDKSSSITTRITDEGNTVTSTMTLNKEGKPLKQLFFDENGKVSQTTEYGYDKNGRMITELTNHSTPQQTEAGNIIREQVNYLYDKEGLITSIEYWADDKGYRYDFKYGY